MVLNKIMLEYDFMLCFIKKSKSMLNIALAINYQIVKKIIFVF